MLKYFLNKIRNLLLFKLLYPWVKIGKNIHCQFSTKFWSPNKCIVLGNNVGIGYNCIFLCDITIGNKVLIASNVSFINSDDHNYNIIGKTIWDSGRGDKFNITIEDDVWIGQGAILISPCCIGRGSIIAAGSVVTKNLNRYSIYAGVPAKLLKKRFTDNEIFEHESILIKNNDMTESGRTICDKKVPQ
jgi:acetyltransferase-like isoleucine patch superfamily enzyme